MHTNDINHEITRISMILGDEIRHKINNLSLNQTAELILGRKHTEQSGLKKMCRAFLLLEEAARHTLNLE